jgi:RNA polymerase sigma-70 factor (ECF subfamily)
METPVSLLQRLRQPDAHQAWDCFVELYTPLLYYWARRMALQPHDAADLVQDVFALLVLKLPEFHYDDNRSFRGWLRAVTVHKWRERCRRRSPGADGSLADQPDNRQAEDLWEAEYRQEVTRQALRIMQTDFEPATWKACWETVAVGRPAAEVAAELGLSVNAVYLARTRVLRRLRQELSDLLD